jgi:hypothetical protein
MPALLFSAAMLGFDDVSWLWRNAQSRTFVDRWREAAEHHIDRYLGGEIDFQDQRRERLRDTLDREMRLRESERLFSVYLRQCEANWCLFDDVLPCLGRLKGAMA